MKISIVLGTRPEIIKFYSIIESLKQNSEVSLNLLFSGQHYDYEMSQIFFEELKITTPDVFLNIDQNLSHAQQTSQLVTSIEKELKKNIPDLVLVLGDTNTALSGGLVATKLRIRVGHIEAGCRSFDYRMPEEINRVLLDSISDYCFAPSQVAYLNLLYEGKFDPCICFSGNTQVDILKSLERRLENSKSNNLNLLELPEKFVVATLHREENVDNQMKLRHIVELLTSLEEQIIFPIHPRTLNNLKKYNLMQKLIKNSNIKSIKPLGYIDFLRLLKKSSMVLTDSGGVQEETVILNKPTITFRENTEWPETVWCGMNYLVGDQLELFRNSIKTIKSMYIKGDSGLNVSLYPEWHAGEKAVSFILKQKENIIGEKTRTYNMIKKGYPIPHLTVLRTEDQENREVHLSKNYNFKFTAEGNPIIPTQRTQKVKYILSRKPVLKKNLYY